MIEEGLALRNLCKNFGTFSALKNVSFDLKQGDVACLLGHNGAGKSTLINILTGILKPTSGKMTFKGKNFRTLMKEHEITIGICPSYNVFIDKLTVEQNLKLTAIITGNGEREIQYILNFLDLIEFRSFLPDKLSGGY